MDFITDIKNKIIVKLINSTHIYSSVIYAVLRKVERGNIECAMESYYEAKERGEI